MTAHAPRLRHPATAMNDAGAIGVVTHIQPFSLHDGPGIRSTVFLKGCPLRCAWCHNPETMQAAPVLAYQAADCVACGACVAACPARAQRLDGAAHRLDRSACTACGACVPACPRQALELVGERLSADAVLARILPDRPFHQSSGGGMTLSGGEPTMQPGFALALLRLAGAAGVHRAVETCAVCPPERLDALRPQVELWLVDWKDSDDARHRRATGAGNAGIRANLRRLHDAGARIRLRCPIVPGWNDRADHFAGIAALAAELPRLEGVELLPYHGLGGGKAARFGLPPAPCAGVAAPDAATVAAWQAELRRRGAPLLARA